MKKTDHIAILSLFTSLIRVLGGPITILMVSSHLSLEEMGFYYTFFSFIVMTQLFEVGIGFVLKQFYSHDCKYYGQGVLSKKSLIKSSKLFIFSCQWYIGLAIIYLVLLIPFSKFYYFNYEGDIEFEGPLLLLLVVTSLKLVSNIIDTYLDGMQKQIILQKARLFSSITMSLSLWLLISLGYQLYSIGLSLFLSIQVFVLVVLYYKKNIGFKIIKAGVNYSFLEQFREIFPLLSRSSLVWFFGYFFWNGFTLLGFHLYGASIAGQIGFSIAMAKGGYDVANSFSVNQRTIIANKIANDKLREAIEIFFKYSILSLSVLTFGYLIIISVKVYFSEFEIVSKMLDTQNLITLFLFYIFILVMTSVNNFVRSFKIEPFVYLSIYNSTSLMMTFYLSYYWGLKNILLLSMIFLIPSLIYSFTFFLKKIGYIKLGIADVK